MTSKKSAPIEAPDEAIHDEFSAAGDTVVYRPVTIVDTSEKKRLDLTIEVPVEDMAKMGQADDIPSGPALPAVHARRSGRRFIRGCSNWCGRTSRR